MTIWINNPFDMLPDEGGRPQRYALMANAFAKAGHNAVWWSSDWSHLGKRRRTADSSSAQSSGYRLILVPTRPYYGNVSFRRLLSHWRYAIDWRRLAERMVADGTIAKPDIIIVSTPPLSLFKEARKLALRWNARTVLDIQDLWPETFLQVLPPFARYAANTAFYPLRYLAENAYRHADAVTCVCDAYVRACRRSDACRFYHGIELPQFVRTEDRAPNDHDIFKIVYIGNLGTAYRLEECAEAVNLLNASGLKCVLNVAGDGPKKAWLSEKPFVKYHGVLGGAELIALLHNSDVGLIPMVDATCVGMPGKLADYAANGLAVLSGLGGESLELLRSFGAGFAYNADSAADLAEKIKILANDSAILRDMKAGSRALAEQCFDATRIYEKYAATVGELK